MLHYRHGNLLEANAEAYVNPVNTVGVMGKGLALAFKNRFPTAFDAYRKACNEGRVRIGSVFVYERPESTGRPRVILHVPTKRHWREPSQMSFVEQGLEALVDTVRQRGILSVAVPALGCGLGGLAWAEVRPRMVQALQALPHVEVYLFLPHDEPTTNP